MLYGVGYLGASELKMVENLMQSNCKTFAGVAGVAGIRAGDFSQLCPGLLCRSGQEGKSALLGVFPTTSHPRPTKMAVFSVSIIMCARANQLCHDPGALPRVAITNH